MFTKHSPTPPPASSPSNPRSKAANGLRFHNSIDPMPDKPVKLAVLISGSGRTLQNLIDEIAAGGLNAQIALVLASREGLPGIDRARHANLPVVVVDRREFTSTESFSQRIFS